MRCGVYLQRRRGRLAPGLGEQVKSMCTCTKPQLFTPPSPLPPALRAPCCLLLEPREGRPGARAPVVPLAVLQDPEHGVRRGRRAEPRRHPRGPRAPRPRPERPVPRRAVHGFGAPLLGPQWRRGPGGRRPGSPGPRGAGPGPKERRGRRPRAGVPPPPPGTTAAHPHAAASRRGRPKPSDVAAATYTSAARKRSARAPRPRSDPKNTTCPASARAAGICGGGGRAGPSREGG